MTDFTELVEPPKRSPLNEKQNILKYLQPSPAAIDSILFELPWAAWLTISWISGHADFSLHCIKRVLSTNMMGKCWEEVLQFCFVPQITP